MMFTNVDCPKPNCRGKVVYNGNYFCEFHGYSCDWALSHNDINGEPIGSVDQEMWEKIKKDVGIRDME